MVEQRLIVGLGNPGHLYQRTRHNAGFLLIDRLIARWQVEALPADQHFLIWRAVLESSEVFLMKPLTFMNLSGLALQRFLQRITLALDHVLIAYDDVALPLGALRIRRSGSGGGQKGMGNIIDCLQSNQIPRLRLGIQAEGAEQVPLRDWVLQPFAENELDKLQQMLDRAVQACECWLSSPMTTVMSQFNVKAPATPTNSNGNPPVSIRGGEN